MEDMQQQMNAILSNPEMIQKIMSMAQSLNQTPQEQQTVKPDAPTLPDIDLTTVRKLSGLAGKANIDKNQRSLLAALTPYLSQQHIRKLEKAMRAAKMASLASSLLSSSGFQFPTGR